MSLPTHIHLVHLKVTSLKEAEEFYDLLFEVIGLNSKEQSDFGVIYWGPFGVMISEQQDVLAHIDPQFRLGFTQLGVRVGTKEIVDKVYRVMSDKKYIFDWKPKSFEYSKEYYSTCIYDPDDNKFEFIFDS